MAVRKVCWPTIVLLVALAAGCNESDSDGSHRPLNGGTGHADDRADRYRDAARHVRLGPEDRGL
jgi:hypothetical protein